MNNPLAVTFHNGHRLVSGHPKILMGGFLAPGFQFVFHLLECHNHNWSVNLSFLLLKKL